MFIQSSACGRTTASVDQFDLYLSPHGFICCPSCRTIFEAREAWADLALADL